MREWFYYSITPSQKPQPPFFSISKLATDFQRKLPLNLRKSCKKFRNCQPMTSPNCFVDLFKNSFNRHKSVDSQILNFLLFFPIQRLGFLSISSKQFRNLNRPALRSPAWRNRIIERIPNLAGVNDTKGNNPPSGCRHMIKHYCTSAVSL